LNIEIVAAYSPGEFGVQLPPEASISPAFSLAARLLAGQTPVFEFLPPKPTLIEQFATKYSSGRLRTIGAIAAGIVAIVGGLFLFQEFELILLRSRWSAMSAKVGSFRLCRIKSSNTAVVRRHVPRSGGLRQLTLAFPEDGSVTAKTIEIQNNNTVSCSGNAQNNARCWRRSRSCARRTA